MATENRTLISALQLSLAALTRTNRGLKRVLVWRISDEAAAHVTRQIEQNDIAISACEMELLTLLRNRSAGQATATDYGIAHVETDRDAAITNYGGSA